jgi:thiosulfate/3-mercaptopyruvate sulfurtransferase
MRSFFLLSLLVLSLQAATGFISSEALNKILDDKKLVIIDVGSLKDFDEGHIPHAMRSEITSWRKPVGLHQLMRSNVSIEKEMRRLGINQDSQIVIYGHNKSKEALKSSYIALAMITHGLKRVALLDGQFAEWEDEDDREISTTLTKNRLGDFNAKYKKGTIVDLEYVKANINKVPMLEARPPVFYYGTLRSRGVKRIGHIPHAMSSFWKDKFEIDGMLKEQEVLNEIFISGYNLKPKKEVILYCTGGLEASMNWFILSQHMHFNNAKIYDASLREWANRDDTPLVRYKWETFGY